MRNGSAGDKLLSWAEEGGGHPTPRPTREPCTYTHRPGGPVNRGQDARCGVFDPGPRPGSSDLDGDLGQDALAMRRAA